MTNKHSSNLHTGHISPFQTLTMPPCGSRYTASVLGLYSRMGRVSINSRYRRVNPHRTKGLPPAARTSKLACGDGSSGVSVVKG